MYLDLTICVVTVPLLPLKIIWNKHFGKSCSDHRTLGQLFALINRLPTASNPKKDMNSSTDALFTVLKGYFLAFACEELKIDNIDSDLEHSILKSTTTLEKQRFIACTYP